MMELQLEGSLYYIKAGSSIYHILQYQVPIFYQLMEPSQYKATSNKTLDTLADIKAGLTQYYENRSKLQVWNKIFWVLEVYIGKEGPIGLEGQKLINFFLQNKPQSSIIGPLVVQHKEIICKLIEMNLQTSESIDESISTGHLGEVIAKKFLRTSDQSSKSIFQLIYYCTQAVCIHFCQFLRKFRDNNQAPIVMTSRKISKIIKRKYIDVSSSRKLCEKMLSEPVVLLEGFLDLLKPMIGNHLNIQSLFQVTSPHFKLKKSFLSGNIEHANSKTEFTGKIVKLNSIFDATHAGRQMIQTRLSNLVLIPEIPASSQYWSILSPLSEQQPIMLHIVQHLPQFLRPKSNGDILSFSRQEFFPTFKYQVSKSGYTSKPILCQFVTIFMNVGKGSLDFICFTNKSGVTLRVKRQDYFGKRKSIQNQLDGCGIQYMKVRVQPRSIAVVPSNTYYIIIADPAQTNVSGVSQIVFWSVLPKFYGSIKSTIDAIEQKKKQYKNYNCLPMQQIFLDYLNHEYMQASNLETLSLLKSYIEAQIQIQQQLLFSQTKKHPQISVTHINPSSYASSQSSAQAPSKNSLRCAVCYQYFVNYYGRTSRRENLCMKCILGIDNSKNKIQQFVVMYRPNDIRYPLTLVGLYISKRKYPGSSIQNRYQRNVCCGKFIGAIDTENCKVQASINEANRNSKMKQFLHCTELFLQNYQKQLGIASPSQILTALAIQEPQSEAEKQMLIQKMKGLVKLIEDPELLVKQLMPKFSFHNLITELLWTLKLDCKTLRN